jgi:hypothetical protein
MDPAGGVLDDSEAVRPGERDRLGMKEITDQDPFGLGAQELSPGRSRGSPCEPPAPASTRTYTSSKVARSKA